MAGLQGKVQIAMDSGGGYFATVEFVHQLHCLVRLIEAGQQASVLILLLCVSNRICFENLLTSISIIIMIWGNHCLKTTTSTCYVTIPVRIVDVGL